MRTVCWQTILMKYHTLFLLKTRKDSQNLSSAAVVIGALRAKYSMTLKVDLLSIILYNRIYKII